MATSRFGRAARIAAGTLRHAGCAAWPACDAALVALLAGCAVQVQNTKPVQDLAVQRERRPGSIYLGWRVFTEKCARCHGASGAGTGLAPDLVARMSDMGPRRFAHLVLVRYDLDDTAPRARDDAVSTQYLIHLQGLGAPRARRRRRPEAQIEDILQRRDRPLAMPAWQGEPRVSTADSMPS